MHFGCGAIAFIHIIICLFAIIYKSMKPHHTIEEIDVVIHAVYEGVTVPFWML